MAVPVRAYLSIGEVLSKLRAEFSDITISKIRFLESEGLIEPQRTPSGYRKFTNSDLERLRFVLLAQRDQYLPLRVIKENLDAIDRGLAPSANSGGIATPRLISQDGALTSATIGDDQDLRLTRAELISASEISDDHLAELESYGIISIRGRYYDADALAIAKTVVAISAFGIGARHLRSFKTAADREIGLVEQVTAPIRSQKGAEAKAKAEETERELAVLSIRLHASLVRAGLRRSK
ncbi:MAG: MerR family transcriptional regulator [Actinobacteria bacterium]|nr:MerR family transcriptional regulator [Actinomycetota bacterium]